MEQSNCTIERGKYKHLTEKERYKIEGYLVGKDMELEEYIHRYVHFRIDLVAPRGLEPRLLDSESSVLPIALQGSELNYIISTAGSAG